MYAELRVSERNENARHVAKYSRGVRFPRDNPVSRCRQVADPSSTLAIVTHDAKLCCCVVGSLRRMDKKGDGVLLVVVYVREFMI